MPAVVSHGAKQPERGADHTPPSSAAVQNEWRFTSAISMGLCGTMFNLFCPHYDAVKPVKLATSVSWSHVMTGHILRTRKVVLFYT
jgi:hypothetical protein